MALRLVPPYDGLLVINALLKFVCRTDELKWGNLVGVDKFGNKYYENKLYFMGLYNFRVVLLILYHANCMQFYKH